MSYDTVSVTTSATLIVSASEARKELKLCNTANGTIVYLGQDSSVTTSNGFPLYENQSVAMERDWGQWLGDVYGIVGSGTADIRYWESKGI